MAIPVFVFGTLRPGYYNYSLVEDQVQSVRKSVAAKGQMYYANPGYTGYPIVDFRENGMVTGDLLYFSVKDPLEWWRSLPTRGRFDPYGGLEAAFAMEEGAGYTPRYIDTLTPGGVVIKAVAFAWEHSKQRRPRGMHISSGSWHVSRGSAKDDELFTEEFQRWFAKRILRRHPALQE